MSLASFFTGYETGFPTRYSPGVPSAPASFFEMDLVGFLRSMFGLVVHPGHIPQGSALPALSFLQLRAAREPLLAGGNNGIAEAHYQITISSTDYFDIGTISATLETLDGYRGPMGSSFVAPALLENEVTRYDDAVDGSDLGTHSKMIDFAFYYRTA